VSIKFIAILILSIITLNYTIAVGKSIFQNKIAKIWKQHKAEVARKTKLNQDNGCYYCILIIDFVALAVEIGLLGEGGDLNSLWQVMTDLCDHEFPCTNDGTCTAYEEAERLGCDMVAASVLVYVETALNQGIINSTQICETAQYCPNNTNTFIPKKQNKKNLFADLIK